MEQKRYAMYLRKSRADMELEAMGQEETLARHKSMLFALAARHEIHPDQITIYHELVSGDSIDERPEMQRLLADVYAKAYAGVLVVEVERLARGNTKDQGEVADAFQASGTNIITPSKVYDPNNEFDQEYFEFGLFMSRREYKTIKRRLESGKKASVREGNYILPQRVFGYQIIRTTKKDRTLEPIQEEAAMVRQIFDWYTKDGRSIGWIANRLTMMGIQTVKNKPEWNPNTIRDMLANPVYIGKVQWGKKRTVKEFDSGAGKLVKVVKNDGVQEVYDGKHPGIVDEGQWQLAQRITARRHTPKCKVDHEIINPYAGLIRCKLCGRNMTALTFAAGYVTRLQHPRGTVCKMKALPLPDVTAALVEALEQHITDFKMRIENGGNREEMERYRQTMESMESELAKLERKRRNLFAAYEDEVYSRDEFIERKQVYNASIDRIKIQLAEMRKNAPAPVDYAEQITTIHDVIACIQSPDTSAKAKNDFLQRFVDHIDYNAIDLGRRKGGMVELEVFLR